MRRRHVAHALLIDFDGVLRHYDRPVSAQIEERHGLPPGAFLEAGLEWTRYIPAVTGTWTRSQWLDAIAEATGAPREAVLEWDAYRGYIDHEVLGFVREVRAAGKAVGLATNATSDLRDDLTRFDLDHEFDAVISSAELGVHKPSKEFFLAACAAVGTKPEMVLFVDDTDRNVRGARASGLSALRFTGLGDLRYIRAALGVSARPPVM
ncbi:MAG TPA: HAD-IA family hydrolase [Candidatus Limnocylindrales bacterium]|nr:HAD-IA family hydrolase [Candidatus Limnocylindrales bacterium]